MTGAIWNQRSECAEYSECQEEKRSYGQNKRGDEHVHTVSEPTQPVVACRLANLCASLTVVMAYRVSFQIFITSRKDRLRYQVNEGTKEIGRAHV